MAVGPCCPFPADAVDLFTEPGPQGSTGLFHGRAVRRLPSDFVTDSAGLENYRGWSRNLPAQVRSDRDARDGQCLRQRVSTTWATPQSPSGHDRMPASKPWLGCAQTLAAGGRWDFCQVRIYQGFCAPPSAEPTHRQPRLAHLMTLLDHTLPFPNESVLRLEAGPQEQGPARLPRPRWPSAASMAARGSGGTRARPGRKERPAPQGERMETA